MIVSIAPPVGIMLNVSFRVIAWDTLKMLAAMFLSVLSDAPWLPTCPRVRSSAMLALSIGIEAELMVRLVGSLGNSELRTTATDPDSTS